MIQNPSIAGSGSVETVNISVSVPGSMKIYYTNENGEYTGLVVNYYVENLAVAKDTTIDTPDNARIWTSLPKSEYSKAPIASMDGSLTVTG